MVPLSDVGHEQRRTPRFQIEWPIEYQALSPRDLTQERCQTTTLDVGEGGIGFVAKSELPLGSICAFWMPFPPSFTPVLALGKIIWQKGFEGQLVTGARWVYWEEGGKEMLIMLAKSAPSTIVYLKMKYDARGNE